MAGTELMLEAIKLYESRAESARASGNLEGAKQNYLLAADALSKLAKISTEPLKTERFKRVERLKQRAQECADGKKKTVVTENGHAKSVKSAADDEEQDDSDSDRSFYTIEKPDLKFSDIAGLCDVKERIKEAMLYPFTYSNLYREYNQKAGGGILLFGLPGTGKTMLARAAASELDAKFFNISGGALKDKYFGESEKKIRRLFEDAEQCERAILYFDEFEEIAERKETEGSNPTAGMVTELLRQMDGFTKKKNTMFFMAATNKPWLCDGALLRPGRFGTKICIPLPDFDARLFLVKKGLKSLPVSGEISADSLAEKFEGCSGADIASEYDGFFAKLKRFAIQKCIRENEGKPLPITSTDIDSVMADFKSSILGSDMEKLQRFIEKGE